MIEDLIRKLLKEAIREILPEVKPQGEWITRDTIKSEIGISDSVIRQWEDDGLPYMGQKPKIYSRTKLNEFLQAKINEHTRYPGGRN